MLTLSLCCVFVSLNVDAVYMYDVQYIYSYTIHTQTIYHDDLTTVLILIQK